MNEISFSTGITALDELLHNVLPGDNIIFQVDSIKDYIPFVHAFCIDNEKHERPLIYFRFADHESLVPPNMEVETFQMHPEMGFEHFIDEIFIVIEKYGRGAAYVFDLLSELAVDWYSDRMVANFFMLTCPYLYDFETGTYFALLRDEHSQYTISKIQKTAQIVLDIYNMEGKIYLHPLKVWKRHSPTMYMLHAWRDDEFFPVTKSSEISEILAKNVHPWIDFTTKIQDIWSKTFDSAHNKLQDYEKGKCTYQELEPLKKKMIRMAITRDPKVFPNIYEYFEIRDLLDIGRRMIGTGLIGGKSTGMLLAQNILKKKDGKWESRLERHDSFFIGSDIFYTYLVKNKCWWIRYRIRKTQSREEIFQHAAEARQSLRNGKFPAAIIEQFKHMLNYYGQSPIIVRSSSLMEDAYGNAFSGKYESIFLVNQGTPTERLNLFMEAVRKVYESSMSERALSYRLRRNLLDKDEQMAILVQRVSGAAYGKYFYPQLAGVGYSFNPFIWNKEIDPNSGMIRLVFGLGTRAVDRYDDDYTRIIALNVPNKRPEAEYDEIQKYNQKKVDVLNLIENTFTHKYFNDLVNDSKNFPLGLFSSRDYELERQFSSRNIHKTIYNLDLDKIIQKSPLISDMNEVLSFLSEVYQNPVDIEFTINFMEDGTYRIYILQCRPLQIKVETEISEEPRQVKQENIVFNTDGPIIGHGIAKKINRLIYIIPEAYGEVHVKERYQIARIIGKLNMLQNESPDFTTLLAGPGRWATSSPSLGIPVNFQEINNVSIICEIAEMHANLKPDASLGTHFFNDLVENDMLYMAVDPTKEASFLNKNYLKNVPNSLKTLLGEDVSYSDVIKVVNFTTDTEKTLKIYADPIEQKALIYLE